MRTNISDDWMDSTLWTEDWSSTRPALLAIKIKVFLQREAAQTLTWTSSSGQPQTQQTIQWDGPSWQSWRRDLKRTVERGWSNRLWLEPASQWVTGRDGRPINSPVAPSIRLRLHIDCDVPRSAAHVIIRSYRLPAAVAGQPTPFARSNMEAPFVESSRRCSLQGNDTFGKMDSLDVQPRASGQIPAVHEFGHYIGLSHVNAAAVPNAPNSSIAYGAGARQRGDIMGAGTRIEPWHAYPWCRQLRRHLGGTQPRDTGWASSNPLVWITGTGDRAVRWYPRTGRIHPVVFLNLDLILPGA
jgi:hypothetical protein